MFRSGVVLSVRRLSRPHAPPQRTLRCRLDHSSQTGRVNFTHSPVSVCMGVAGVRPCVPHHQRLRSRSALLHVHVQNIVVIDHAGEPANVFEGGCRCLHVTRHVLRRPKSKCPSCSDMVSSASEWLRRSRASGKTNRIGPVRAKSGLSDMCL